jgi:hypothetical protein
MILIILITIYCNGNYFYDNFLQQKYHKEKKC